MYTDELKPKRIEIEKLLLDGNNPRFWEQKSEPLSDERIANESQQQKLLNDMLNGNQGIEDLMFNILRNGFLPMDRIVVRAANVSNELYVVIEGNRRLTALKELRRRIADNRIVEEGISPEHIKAVNDSISELEVLLYTGTGSDNISWIFQGIRHISGIKEWGSAPQGNLINQLKLEGKSFTEIGQQFGMSAIKVGRLYRGFKGLEQMKNDDEYGRKTKPAYFSLFDEAYRNTTTRRWLGWDESQSTYQNVDNLKRFYALITPDEDNENERRLHDPKHVGLLAALIDKQRDDLLGEVERHETTIETAAGRTQGVPTPTNPIEAIRDAKSLLSKVTATAIGDNAAEVKSALLELSQTIETLLGFAETKL